VFCPLFKHPLRQTLRPALVTTPKWPPLSAAHGSLVEHRPPNHPGPCRPDALPAASALVPKPAPAAAIAPIPPEPTSDPAGCWISGPKNRPAHARGVFPNNSSLRRPVCQWEAESPAGNRAAAAIIPCPLNPQVESRSAIERPHAGKGPLAFGRLRSPAGSRAETARASITGALVSVQLAAGWGNIHCSKKATRFLSGVSASMQHWAISPPVPASNVWRTC